MADTGNDVKVRVGAEVSEFQAAMKNISGELKNLGAPVNGLTSILSKLANPATLAGAALVACGIAAAGLTIKSIELSAELGTLSRKTGVAVSELSTLQYAAGQDEVSLQELSNSLKFLQRSLYDASTGGEEMRNTFKSLGIAYEDSNGKTRGVSAVLKDLQDRFATLPDGVEKTAVAMKLLGREGQNMVPFLSNGSAEVKRLQEEARKLNLEISGDTAKAAKAFGDNMETLKSSATGFGNAMAKTVAPTLQFMSERLKDSLVNGGELQNVFKDLLLVASGLAKAFSFVTFMGIQLFDTLGTAAKKFREYFGEQMQGVVDTLYYLSEGKLKEASSSLGKVLAEGFTGEQLKTKIREGWNEALTKVLEDSKAFEKIMNGQNPLAGVNANMANSSNGLVQSLKKNNKEIENFYKDLGKTVASAMSNMVVSIASGTFKARDFFLQFFQNVLAKTIEFAITQMVIFQKLALAIKAALMNPIVAAITIGAMIAAVAALSGAFGKSSASYANGSDYIPNTQMATVHKGERVVPEQTNRDLTAFLRGEQGGSSASRETYIQIDGKTILRYIEDASRDGRTTIRTRA